MKARMRKMQREKEKNMNSPSKTNISDVSLTRKNSQSKNNQNSKKNNKESNIQLHLSSNSIHSSGQSVSQISNNTNTNHINQIYTKKILKSSLMTGNSAAKPAEDDYEVINSINKPLTSHFKEPIFHHHHNNRKSISNNDMKNIKFPLKKHSQENEKKKHHSKKHITKKKSKSNLTNKNISINNYQYNDNSRMTYFLEQKQNLNPLEKKEELSKMLKLLNTDISVDNFELGQNMNYIESKKELEKLQEEVKEEENKLNALMIKNKSTIHDYIEKIMNLQNQLMISPQWDVITLEEENKIDEVKIKNLKEKIEIIKEENEKEIEEMEKINFDEINNTLRKEIEKVSSLKNTLLNFKGREVPEDLTKEIEVIMKYKNGL